MRNSRVTGLRRGAADRSGSRPRRRRRRSRQPVRLSPSKPSKRRRRATSRRRKSRSAAARRFSAGWSAAGDEDGLEVCRAHSGRLVAADGRRLESEHLITNFADVPSVRALADGSLVAHWIEMNGPDPEAYDLKIATSRDNGKTWSAPVEPSPGRHEDAARLRLVLQLRHRASAWSGSTAARRSGGKGDMTLRAATSLGREERHAGRARACATAVRRPPPTPRTDRSWRSAAGRPTRSATSTSRGSMAAPGRRPSWSTRTAGRSTAAR